MSEPNPLIARVDALLARHRALEDEVPVLTETVEPAEQALEAARFEALAVQVERAVLERLLADLEPLLEERLAPALAEMLEQALAGLRADIAARVHALVKDAVAESLESELALRRKPTEMPEPDPGAAAQQ